MHGCMSHNKRCWVRDIIHQSVRNRFCFDFLQKKIQEFRVQWKHGFFLPCGRKRSLRHRIQPPSWDPVCAISTVHKNFYMAGVSISRLDEERPRKTREKKTIGIQIKTSQDVRIRDLSLLFLLCELHCLSLRIALRNDLSQLRWGENWEVL
jgi:hypothetical protein